MSDDERPPEYVTPWCIRHETELRTQRTQIDAINSAMPKLVQDVNDIRTRVLMIPERIGETLARVDEKLTHLEKRGYVTPEEFDPVKRIVYGLVSMVLVAVIGAMIAVVMNGRPNGSAKTPPTPAVSVPAR